MRFWHPVEFVGYGLFATIWRGQPVHCNVEIDSLIYDNSFDDGLCVLENYPIKPTRSIEVNCKCKEMKIAVYHSLANDKHPKWPGILDSLGIWPKWLKVPYTCVSISCIMLGLPILESRRPVHLLRRICDGHLQVASASTSPASASDGERYVES